MNPRHERLARTARAAAICCALAIAWPHPALAFAIGQLVPSGEQALLALLGIGLTAIGVAIGRKNGDD